MSYVSNVLVVFGYEDYPEDNLLAVNNKMYELDYDRHQQFVEGTSEHGWYGGSKFMEADVWAAAFNYVGLDKVLEALNTADWTYPDEVLIIWQDQNESSWSIYGLDGIDKLSGDTSYYVKPLYRDV